MDAVTICGTDLPILKGHVPEVSPGSILGHEAVGTVLDVGSAVRRVRAGDGVLVSCIASCGVCRFCREGRYGQGTGLAAVMTAKFFSPGARCGGASVSWGRFRRSSSGHVVAPPPGGLSRRGSKVLDAQGRWTLEVRIGSGQRGGVTREVWAMSVRDTAPVRTTRRTTDAWLASAILVLSLGLAVELQAGYFFWDFGLLVAVAGLAWMVAIGLNPVHPALALTLRLTPPGVCGVILAVDGLARVTPWALLVVALLVTASPVARSAILSGGSWLIIGGTSTPQPDRPSPGDLEESRRRHPSARAALPAPDTITPVVLPRVWADSYFALRAAASPPERCHIVELRQSYLDKMQQADPEGFAAWLKSGADPARSFSPRP